MKKWRSLEEKKEALELYYNEGKTQKEIAESMKLSVNTIKSWIRRSRLKKFESSHRKIDQIKIIQISTQNLLMKIHKKTNFKD